MHIGLILASTACRTARLAGEFLVGLSMLTSVGAGAAPAADWQARVTPHLLTVWKGAQTPIPNAGQQSTAPSSAAPRSTDSVRYDSAGRLHIDVSFDCTKAAPSAELVAAGMVLGTIVKIPPMCVVEGWVPVASIPALASLASVKKIDLPHYRTPRHRIPLHTPTPGAVTSATSAIGSTTIDGNGITIMAADQFMTNTGVSGAGSTVGIISDDVQSIVVIQGRGELPTVNIVKPSANPTTHPTFTDEGTMMLEEVHAVAPAASLAFCGPETYTEYVGCATNLIAAGTTIVSDDVSWPGFDTMSAQSPETQAVQTLLVSNPNVMLFTASANQQQNYWQGPYTPDNSSGASYTCNGQTDTYFENFGTTNINVWTLVGATSSLLTLAWADPFGANVSNFDLYVLNTTGAVVGCAPGAGSTDTFDAFLQGAIPSPGTYYLVVGTPDASLRGKFLKLMGTGDGAATFSLNTPGAPFSPQDFATGVYTIGAVDGSDGVGMNIEPFSNTGKIQLELPTPSTLQAPIVAAPDGIYIDTAGTTYPNGLFYGTSAASPNAAAVAALLRSTFPTLTPTATITAMETGATGIAAYGAVPNGTIGYGRVNAIGALGAVPAPTMSTISAQQVVGGTSSPPLPFTIGGTGALTLLATSDNTALVANNRVVIEPSTCPTSTTACNVTIAPVLGQVGTANVTVTITDGAKRTASTRFAVTVTKPTPPTASVTAGASQTITAGGALSAVTFTVTGTQTLTVTTSSSNTTLLPTSAITLNSGCGTAAALSCTATLSVASGQTGTATVTFTVTDPYAQSRAGTASVTVNAPPSSGVLGGKGGGGGALDLAVLAALGGLLLHRQASKTRRQVLV
jgi:Subtilase family